MIKILLITEILKPPYDEGIKKTVFNLYKFLKENYKLKVIARNSFDAKEISIVYTNALFYSKEVRKEINRFKPEVLIYFPFASATFASYLRFKLLSAYAKGAKPILISLQPKSLKKWQVQIVKCIRPKFALTPSPQLKSFWDRIRVNSKLLPLLTDLNTFKPFENERNKVDLRKKYNLPTDAFIISHTGHLNEGRNLKSLIPLQKSGNQVVIAGSSSTPKDSIGPLSIKNELTENGILILERYIEHIEEIYQLSDLYIFPVINNTGSIGMPLSILEARACGIPVITTEFGSIKLFLETDYGNIYYSNPEEFSTVVNQVKKDAKVNRFVTKVNQLNDIYLQIIRQIINE